MAMASTCAAMAGVTAAFSSPAAAVRCSTEPSAPSTSAASSRNSVTFPLLQLEKTGTSSATERPAILDPALHCANLMWFKGSYNTQIFVSEDEPADSVVRRFRKAVMQVLCSLSLPLSLCSVICLPSFLFSCAFSALNGLQQFGIA